MHTNDGQNRRVASRTNTKLTRSQQDARCFVAFPLPRRSRIPFGNKHIRTHTNRKRDRRRRIRGRKSNNKYQRSSAVYELCYSWCWFQCSFVWIMFFFLSSLFRCEHRHQHYLDASVMRFIFLSFHFILSFRSHGGLLCVNDQANIYSHRNRRFEAYTRQIQYTRNACT